MANLIIKPATGDGNQLIVQNQAGEAILTSGDAGDSTIVGKVNTPNIILTPVATAPSSPTAGQQYYDSVKDVLYIYNGNSWVQLNNTSMGGIITVDGARKIHTFKQSGTFTPHFSGTVDFLVVAGGGGGGNGWQSQWRGGGGGAGGLRTSYGPTSGGGGSPESKLSVTAWNDYTVIVGAGGDGYGSNGNDSSFHTIAAAGGGGGGNSIQGPSGAQFHNGLGLRGGSGGGSAGGNGTASAGRANQGYGGSGGNPVGYAAGNGGGAGVGNTNAGGLAVSISGTSVTYSQGGDGGGGEDSQPRTSTGNDGWGGDGSSGTSTGHNGNSGIVIISYNY
tara:strand:+ start:3217 stop:4215 length:999 start_codon:yes stop_codon:yes gene_type:complete